MDDRIKTIENNLFEKLKLFLTQTEARYVYSAMWYLSNDRILDEDPSNEEARVGKETALKLNMNSQKSLYE